MNRQRLAQELVKLAEELTEGANCRAMNSTTQAILDKAKGAAIQIIGVSSDLESVLRAQGMGNAAFVKDAKREAAGIAKRIEAFAKKIDKAIDVMGL